jgi:hypothetical protein
MSNLAAVVVAGAIACPGSAEWTDVTAYVDPALPALAVDFAAVALEKRRGEFAYANVVMDGDEILVLLQYNDNGAPRSFNVIINTTTWERKHDPEE